MTDSFIALMQELNQATTSHQRRRQIGEQLAAAGDPRSGIGVQDGTPDIFWLPISLGGKVTIIRNSATIPPQDFDVAPFYIAKYPVTYAQYDAFVQAEDGFDNLAWWQGMPEAHKHQPLAQQRIVQANNARDTISWYQSIAFARWLTQKLSGLELPKPAGGGTFKVGDDAQIRLPTEWEWQWAAQNGAEIRDYPWGQVQPDYANTGESGLEQTIAVGMYPQGATACGAMDMAGNLMEWCLNDKLDLQIIDIASTAVKPLRGGDWGYGIENAACGYCDDEEPSRRDFLNGFRLVLGHRLVS
ncbi:MAG: SUMF1/EgtB/PvdO family nonheme iron enzyme [Chloroflexota bacterium]